MSIIRKIPHLNFKEFNPEQIFWIYNIYAGKKIPDFKIQKEISELININIKSKKYFTILNFKIKEKIKINDDKKNWIKYLLPLNFNIILDSDSNYFCTYISSNKEL